MKIFYIFSILSVFLVAPLNPALSAVGLSVCPVMREHGFIFGCNINSQFIMSLLIWNLTVGNFIIYIGKIDLKLNLLKFEKSVALSSSFFLLSVLGLIFFYNAASESISEVGSPYARQISAILFSCGIAVIFIQTALVDLIFIKNTDNSNSDHSGSSTTIWNNFLSIGAPLIVLCGFFYFMASLLDAQIDGWSTLQDQKPRFYWGAIIFVCWYLILYKLLETGKSQILLRLEQQASSLKNPESRQKISLIRTAELKTVGQALNDARDVISQRTHLLSNFSKFVSDRLIEEVVKSEELSLEGRTIKAAIIMTDLRDFTSISQQLAPNDVVKMLNIYFDNMIKVLHRNEIIVDKFIGDGLLAYRSDAVNESGSESCCHALRACIEMNQTLHETNKILVSKGLPQIKFGMGVHYGEVVLGAMGSQSRMQYTIIGDSVNQAARLESLCKELNSNFIISKTVYESSSDDLKVLFQGPLTSTVKGISDPVTVYKMKG